MSVTPEFFISSPPIGGDGDRNVLQDLAAALGGDDDLAGLGVGHGLRLRFDGRLLGRRRLGSGRGLAGILSESGTRKGDDACRKQPHGLAHNSSPVRRSPCGVNAGS